MRIKPIEKPKSIFLKLVYWITKKQYGKVISPIKTIYSRSRPLLFFGKKIIDTEKKLKLNKSKKILIRNYVSTLNNCSFCSDLSKYEAEKNRIEVQKIIELLNFKHSDHFSEEEKALLTYVDEITTTKDVNEDTFVLLKKYFSDKEIIEITWICATENYFNLMTKPLGLRSDQLSKMNRSAR
jgi:hypothetical protein